MSQTSPPASLREQGLAALRNREFVPAIHALNEWVTANPLDAEALGFLGVAYSQAGHHDYAIQVLDRAVGLQPASAPLQYNRGVALQSAGRAADAALAFQRALQINPQHPQAAQRLQQVASAAPPPINDPPAAAPGSGSPAGYGGQPAGFGGQPGSFGGQHPGGVSPGGYTQVPPSTPAAGFGAPAAGYAPPAYPGATGGFGTAGPAAPAAPAGPPGTVQCPSCWQFSAPAMLCQNCNSPLPPPPRPTAAPPMGPSPLPPSAYNVTAGGALEFYDKPEAFFRRSVAFAIDYGIIIGIFIVGMIYSVATHAPGSREEENPILGVLLILALGTNFVLMGMRGQTIGKMLMKLRVVGVDGDSCGWWQAYRRMRIQGLSVVLAGLGCFWMLWDEDQQTWHDKWANTYVVRA